MLCRSFFTNVLIFATNLYCTHASWSQLRANGARLAAGSQSWWIKVGDREFHVPAPDSGLSQNISHYYFAIGSEEALSSEMLDRRVDGHGRVHIFHLPEGPFRFGHATANRGDRRGSLSVMRSIKSGMVLSDTFPDYVTTKEYANPLTTQGQAVEAAAVSRITPQEVQADLTAITSMPSAEEPTRSSHLNTATTRFVRFLSSSFEDMGLSTFVHSFGSGRREYKNVVACVPGSSNTEFVIVGAHYDSRPYSGPAPGAIDNGSGVAALLSIARAFTASQISPERGVFFVAFGAEEVGCYGSEAFVQALMEGSDNFPAACRPSAGAQHSAIIMDEVGWRSPNFEKATVNLESYDSFTAEVLDNLAGSSFTHNGDALEVVHSSYPFGSDHMPFLDRGIPAALTIHGDDEAYPDYHKSTDRIENANWDLLAMIAKMNLGGLVRLAGVRSA